MHSLLFTIMLLIVAIHISTQLITLPPEQEQLFLKPLELLHLFHQRNLYILHLVPSCSESRNTHVYYVVRSLG